MSYFRATYEGHNRYHIDFYTEDENRFELVEINCKEAVKEKYSSFTTSYSCGMYGVEFSTDKKEIFFDIQALCRAIVDTEEEEKAKNGEELMRVRKVEYDDEDDEDFDEEEDEEETDYYDEEDHLVKYAKSELRRITRIGDEYQERMNKDVLALIKVISSQGHSGFSINCVLNYFNRLARFKPLSPLTGEDDEWGEITNGQYQNKRYSAVFKDKDGKTYDIEGKVFSDDDGKSWFQNGNSRVEVTFPYTVPDEPEKVILVPKEEK